MATIARRRFLVTAGVISVALVLFVAGVAWARRTASDNQDPAVALLQVEPYPVSPFGQEPLSGDDLNAYMRTQVELLRSPNVLSHVAFDPKIAALPFVASSEDAEAGILEQLEITILPHSYLIRISAPRLDPADAVPLVNAVIDNFLMLDAQWSAATRERQIEHLTSYMNELEGRLTERRTSLELLERDGATVEVDGQRLDRSIAERDLLDCLARLRQTRLERAAAEARSAPDDAEVAALERQIRLLEEDRQQLVRALVEPLDEEANAGNLRAEIESLERIAAESRRELERRRFEARGTNQIIQISEARAK